MARRKPREYPRVIYGPYGARMTITRLEDWPAGWTTTPEGVETVTRRDSPMVPYPRAELKRRLREKMLEFPESAADTALWNILRAAE